MKEIESVQQGFFFFAPQECRYMSLFRNPGYTTAEESVQIREFDCSEW